MSNDTVPHAEHCPCDVEEVTPEEARLLAMFDDWYGDKAYRKHDEIVGWAEKLTEPLRAEVTRLSGELEAARAERVQMIDLIYLARSYGSLPASLRDRIDAFTVAAPAVVSGTSQAAADDTALSVPCPVCGVPVGEQCVGKSGLKAKAHVARLSAAVAGTGEQAAATCGSQYWGGLRQPGNRPILCTLPPHDEGDHEEPETESFWSREPWQWGYVATGDPRPVNVAAVPPADAAPAPTPAPPECGCIVQPFLAPPRIVHISTCTRPDAVRVATTQDGGAQ